MSITFSGGDLQGRKLEDFLHFKREKSDSRLLKELLINQEEHMGIFKHPKRTVSYEARIRVCWGKSSVSFFVRLASRKLSSLMDEVSSIDIRAAVRSSSSSTSENIQGLRNYASALLSIFNSMNFSVVLENEFRKLVMVNKSFCSLFQIPVEPSVLIGADCSDSLKQARPLFVNPDEVVERVEQILKKKETVTNEEVLFSSKFHFIDDFSWACL